MQSQHRRHLGIENQGPTADSARPEAHSKFQLFYPADRNRPADATNFLSVFLEGGRVARPRGHGNSGGGTQVHYQQSTYGLPGLLAAAPKSLSVKCRAVSGPPTTPIYTIRTAMLRFALVSGGRSMDWVAPIPPLVDGAPGPR
jgi:hypothetical protein